MCGWHATAPLPSPQVMVDAVAWNDVADVLVAFADGQLVTWLYPAVVLVDKDLLPATRLSEDAADFGKLPQVRCVV